MDVNKNVSETALELAMVNLSENEQKELSAAHCGVILDLNMVQVRKMLVLEKYENQTKGNLLLVK